MTAETYLEGEPGRGPWRDDGMGVDQGLLALPLLEEVLLVQQVYLGLAVFQLVVPLPGLVLLLEPAQGPFDTEGTHTLGSHSGCPHSLLACSTLAETINKDEVITCLSMYATFMPYCLLQLQ